MNLPFELKKFILSFVQKDKLESIYHEFLDIMKNREPIIHDDIFIHWTELKKNKIDIYIFKKMFTKYKPKNYSLGSKCCNGNGIRLLKE